MPASQSTPSIDVFLSQVSALVRESNGARLAATLHIEPPYPDQIYTTVISELRAAFPKGNEDALEQKCTVSVPEAAGSETVASWTAFLKFLVQYFVFLRDVDVGNLLETYNLLAELVQKVNSALSHGTLGILVLPTVVSYSRSLARLAIGLDKQPHLISHLRPETTDEGGSRETLPEKAANIIRQAFTTCLNDRSGTASGVKDGKPDGKKAGIYKIANLCLKVLFQCRKSRNAQQMFVNIDNQSPPLAVYPRSERVTYLYYLGRFLFSTSHFWRAQLVLQTAFDECNLRSLKQRRLILIYLITSNIILGRFPSNTLLSRPEAVGLGERFIPICLAIRQGDLAKFRRLLSMDDENAAWFLHYRIQLQLRNRCEVLVWRSLTRKAFLLAGSVPDKDSRAAPTLALGDLMRIANFILAQATPQTSHPLGGRKGATPPIFNPSTPFQFNSSGTGAQQGFKALNTTNGTPRAGELDMLEMESIISSLVVQGLLGGYLSHRTKKFAILGSRTKGAMSAGFPNVWQTIKTRSSGGSDDLETHQVPGWAVEKPKQTNGGAFGPGMVVNLSGARPAGSFGS